MDWRWRAERRPAAHAASAAVSMSANTGPRRKEDPHAATI